MDPDYKHQFSFEKRCDDDEKYCSDIYQDYKSNPIEHGPCAECDRKDEADFVAGCSDFCRNKVEVCKPWCQTQFKDYAEWFAEYSLAYYEEEAKFFCDF